MKRLRKQKVIGEDLYVGIDLHKTLWHVTIHSKDVELFCSSISGDWDALRRILDRYEGNRIHAVYEAGGIERCNAGGLFHGFAPSKLSRFTIWPPQYHLRTDIDWRPNPLELTELCSST
jgi:hypothetical protein